ncbi:Small ribosomal subunit biogenesis [Glugoides intestinalis]
MQRKIFEFLEIKPFPDLDFPIACNCISISNDRQKLLVAGVYKPTIKFFNLKSGIMKFERHIVCDPLKILCLEDDAEKFGVLRSDKTMEFHVKGGLYEKVKMPYQPKDVLINKITAELYMGGKYEEIYRFNMEQGRFLKSIPCAGAIQMSFSAQHGLLCAIGNNTFSVIDSREKTAVFTRKTDQELLTIAQDETGLKYAIGNEDGNVVEYDFRSATPLKEQQFENFARKIQYSGKNLAVAVNSTVKFVIEDNSYDINTIETNFIINDFYINDGIAIIGGEGPQVKTYTCADLGKLPNWAM